MPTLARSAYARELQDIIRLATTLAGLYSTDLRFPTSDIHGDIALIVGVPKEIKRDEYRVAMLPVGVEELVRARHQVLVEARGGLGSGLPDEVYEEQGARLVDSAGRGLRRGRHDPQGQRAAAAASGR